MDKIKNWILINKNRACFNFSQFCMLRIGYHETNFYLFVGLNARNSNDILLWFFSFSFSNVTCIYQLKHLIFISIWFFTFTCFYYVNYIKNIYIYYLFFKVSATWYFKEYKRQGHPLRHLWRLLFQIFC
jgi:amino acid transporter